jgi:N6-adenosine-specific RNA methylase IME4
VEVTRRLRRLQISTTSATRPIFATWGFEFRSSFVWVKPQIGIGNYWRNSHEFLLTAVRGDAKKFADKSLKSWAQFDRGKHSAKPEQVRAMLERASGGPYLELFGRAPVEGWTVFGDQIDRDRFLGNVREVAFEDAREIEAPAMLRYLGRQDDTRQAETT